MSLIKQLIQELIPANHLDQYDNHRRIEAVRQKVDNLNISQLQQIVREFSHLLYQRDESAHTQLFILQLIKELLLGGSFPLYIFANVYVFPWVVSVNNFHRLKPLSTRATLFEKDSIGSSIINKSNLQSFKELLSFAQEFLIFFGQHLKFHPFSKYKISSCLSKELQQNQYKRQLTHFTKDDSIILRTNIKNYGVLFRKHLSELTYFISEKTQESITDSTKFHDNLYLIIKLVQIGESYCINSIIYRLGALINPENVLSVCKIIDSIMLTGQIQAIQTSNIKCLPLVLQFLFPVDFRSYSLVNYPKHVSQTTIAKLVDYFYAWHLRTKMINLSTKIYDVSYSGIEYLKKGSKIEQEQRIQEFKSNLSKVKQNNEIKRDFVIDQHREDEDLIIKLLKQVVFCISSQKKQVFENILDQLTITQKQSKMSQFSQSLVNSLNNRQTNGNQVSTSSSKSLRGPPKKFRNSSSKYSKISKISKIDKHSEQFQPKQQLQNIYYNGAINKRQPLLKFAQSQQYQQSKTAKLGQINNSSHQKSNKSSRQYQYYQAYQSFNKIPYYDHPKVTANEKPSPNKNQVKFMTKQSISLHSSQFSQKQNNLTRKGKEIDSVYLTKTNKKQEISESKDRSGEFIYFQKDSEIKSEKKLENGEKSQNSQINSQIQFSDSLKNMNQTESEYIIEYGIDKNAKIPETVKKPKFSFKNIETDDSSMILKDIVSSKKQKNLQLMIQTPKRLADSNKIISPRISPIDIFNGSNINSLSSQFFKMSRLKGSKQFSVKKSIFQDKIIYKNEDSLSSYIKENSAQPHLMSQQISYSDQKIPSNFGSVFKQKSEKASVLSSSRSIQKLRHLPERQVEIPDFKKLRFLQNELGKLKSQTQEYNKLLKQKENQVKKLQKQKDILTENDPYYLKKQNQIMKVLLKNKQKSPQFLGSMSSARLSKQLKESSIKNYNMSLKDYNTNVLKLKLQNIQGYSKQIRKNIISNRCILQKNDLIEIGYSFKNRFVTLYFTLKNYCETLEINLIENCVKYSQSIRRSFDKLYVGKQMKFKTEVEGTKDNDHFISSVIHVKVNYQLKLQQKIEQYQFTLPLTPINIVRPISSSQASLLQVKGEATKYITPLYRSSQDLIKKGKGYLSSIFSNGQFNDEGNIFTLNYQWKNKIERIDIKLKQRSFRIEGTGYPLQTGRELIQNIINMLIDPINQ